jgi:uncharacterized protein
MAKKLPPLAAAVLAKNLPQVRDALAAGCNPNGRIGSHVLLERAVSLGNRAIVRALLEAGADPNKPDRIVGETPIFSANTPEMLTLLLEFGANPCHISKLGGVRIHQLASYGRTTLLKVLLQQGCDPNLADNDGDTPLIEAARMGHVETVKLLLRHGADVDRRGRGIYGTTALTVAAGRGHRTAGPRIIAALLDAGANIEGPVKGGSTPLMWAARSKNLDIAKLLLRRGANVNANEADGWTPLIWAIRGEDVAMVKFLLKAGANPRIKVSPRCENRSMAGRTLAEIAQQASKRAIREMFSE